jgi:hypothetical protein
MDLSEAFFERLSLYITDPNRLTALKQLYARTVTRDVKIVQETKILKLQVAKNVDVVRLRSLAVADQVKDIEKREARLRELREEELRIAPGASLLFDECLILQDEMAEMLELIHAQMEKLDAVQEAEFQREKARLLANSQEIKEGLK